MKRLALSLLLSAVFLAGCKSSGGKKEKKEPAQTKKEQPAQPTADQDFNAFLGRLRKAIEAHDVHTIASMMTEDFAFVMGDTPEADRKGDGVFRYWDENGLWPELEGIITENFVTKGDYMVAPAQFANPTVDYTGYRAGIRRVNGSWKFAYFVNG